MEEVEEACLVEMQKYFKLLRKFLVIFLKLDKEWLDICFERYIPFSFVDTEIDEITNVTYSINLYTVLLKYVNSYMIHYYVYPKFRKDLHNYLFNSFNVTKRKNIRLKGNCQICKVNLDSNETHHIIPICYGGSNEEYNLMSTCSRCHSLDPFEIVFKYFKKLCKNNELDILLTIEGI